MTSITAPTPAAPAAAPADSDRGFFGHPRGLATLFFTEMWERFSYYGMRAILILFMTAAVAQGGLGFDAAKAGVIYGTYTALVYLAGLPGGWLADRFLGQRRATLFGGVLIMSGHICLAVPAIATFYLGLALVVSGTGLLKPNISTMVGQLYGPDDARRDAGFSMFYMGINLGAFISPLVCGWLAQSARFRGVLASAGLSPETAWHWGFGAAAVGMLLGLVQYMSGWKYLGAAGMEPVPPKDAEDRLRQRRRLQLGIGLALALAAALAGLSATGMLRVTPEGLGDAFGVALVAVTVVLFVGLLGGRGWSQAERKQLIVIAVLFVASTVFWAVFEQAGSTLNLFAQRNTDLHALGVAIPASWLQSLEPVFTVIFAPIFAWLWLRMGRRDPSSPAKFAWGLLLVGLGFAILIAAAQLSAAGVRVSPMWLVVTYLLHSWGELCLSPVGLSATTRLAPARVAGLMMGVWFLSLSLGNYLGGRVAGLYESLPLPTLFGAVAACAIAAAVVLALLVRPIKAMLARADTVAGEPA